MQQVLFIDRDGTLALEPDDQQLDAPEKLVFYPEVMRYLGRIARETNYRLVMVTNQDGLGTDSFPETTFWPTHELMLRALAGEGIEFDEVIIDRTFARDNKPTRKPGTALLTHYMEGDYDLANSFVLGDRLTDMKLAANLNAQGILIGYSGLGDEELAQETVGLPIALKTQSWSEIHGFLRKQQRTTSHRRTTKETDISIRLDLDGEGRGEISTGLNFFDHMLDQIARHGDIDLELTAKGDLHIDEHHTIEDTGLALGEAFAKTLGDKRGLMRYGFALPMDDAEAQVSVDFGGRPWMVWDADFKREKVGDMPTEMFSHFFKSFSDAAKCNLNVRCTGDNEHHKIEAIFKAFAKAVRMAVRMDLDKEGLPTTKGVV
ncbi:MAG: bifunctional histidinol-phosphatase/imidazoleglycerol-phosphate dehydratase HisB [Saprospiraceae bacterium]